MSSDRVGGSGIVRRHKATHATGGTDALTPADIGAAATGDVVSNSLISGTKGSVPVGTGSTVAALSPGDNGEVLYVDSSATNGLRWQPVYNAGRNRIINGGFDVWARGTSFTTPTSSTYTADRWIQGRDGTGTFTVSRQAFTAGTAPVAGYEGTYFLRYDVTAAGTSTYHQVIQKIEDVRTFAGQTVTISFWARLNSGTLNTPYVRLNQSFGSGGSSQVTGGSNTFTPTSSWQRFTATVSLASISGKTIGTGSSLDIDFVLAFTTAFQLDIWGVQVEAGNVATRFEEEPYEATLRKCQRYYYLHASGTNKAVMNASYYTASALQGIAHFPVTMRTAPSLVVASGTNYYRADSGSNDDFDGLTIASANETAANLYVTSNVSGTSGRPAIVTTNNASASIAFSAEL